jgi:hypothetical protein
MIPRSEHSSDNPFDTGSKALRINLDTERYGTFAEIGAGQEVVRWFFRAGGASQTIAKSMSAYDMTVSDAIYGKTDRYVSKFRLTRMLALEQSLNLERLSATRGDKTAFFVFADTVSARNFQGTNECHGWMGVRFQNGPLAEEGQIILHVRMLDDNNGLQQEALGIVGVNLLHAAFYDTNEPEKILKSLFDSLTTSRIEIDMVEFSGDTFRNVDNRLMSVRLVQLGLSSSAMFGPDGSVLQPSEVFRKKNILVERGSFRPVVHVNLDMMACARRSFNEDIRKQSGEEPFDVVEIMEITMSNLMSSGESGDIDVSDFLARADVLAACGQTVLISDFSEYYRLSAYLARYTKGKIAIAMGIPSLKELFNEKYYTHLEGGILESFGRLFKNDLKLYVYPMLNRETNELVSIHSLKVAEDLQKLYEHMVNKGVFADIKDFNPDFLKIFSREVLQRISKGDNEWETQVPPVVAGLIKRRKLFGYIGT